MQRANISAYSFFVTNSELSFWAWKLGHYHNFMFGVEQTFHTYSAIDQMEVIIICQGQLHANFYKLNEVGVSYLTTIR